MLSKGGLMEILSSPLHCLRYVETMIHLYEEQEQGDTGISRAFVDAAQIAIAHGNLARGCVFAERAISRWRVSGGDDDAQVLKLGYLVVTPSKLSVYGLSMKWKTEMEEVPTGLDVAECEDWLWRREKSGLKCQPRIVIDQKIFPGFVNLPNMSGGLMDTRQEHHYCFLGEITNSSILHHLRLELKDVDNRKVKLHFYTESLGSEWTPSQIKKGYTVAVLNAKRHVFRFDDPGIRHESLDMLRIFPLPLSKFLALYSQAQEFSNENDEGARTYHGCRRAGFSLQKCAKCSACWYCDRDCQVAGWKEKGHKDECKRLKNQDLRKLLGREWVGGGNGIGFHL